MVSPILVALDFANLPTAVSLARSVRAHVGGFKVGLELMMSEGPRSISQIADLGLPVFADAKLHDIPNTVERAARALSAAGARWVTAHAVGGTAMMQAAVAGMHHDDERGSGVLAVTVLTSLGPEDLPLVGLTPPVDALAVTLAELAASAGAEGVVCSAREVGAIKRSKRDLIAVTPAIRPAGESPHDQTRTATPQQALAAGADYIVVGRPITLATDPARAAAVMMEGIARDWSV